jgi:hypothetical protein
VTFLFIDIQGSTRRREEDSSAIRLAMAKHDEVVRPSIEVSGGGREDPGRPAELDSVAVRAGH